jgi:glutamyl-tRNA synthetase
MSVVTRFAPSPTGFLHIGGARTALFNWLFSRHHGGRFLLRIEDTDRARSTEPAIAAIFDGLKWLGLNWDGEAIFQSTRVAQHVAAARRLLAEGKAYLCFATPEELEEIRAVAKAEGRPWRYDGRWRNRDPATAPAGVRPVIRFRAPREGATVIKDEVQGEIRVENAELDDLVLLRSDGTPTYNLAVVIDDHEMAVTHVIRGHDHLTNTFRQSQLYQALGLSVPTFAHIPLIHGADGAKLSKRHGALGVDAYREMGFLPAAMRNYLLRLGWSHGDDELISTEQAIAWFDLVNVGRSPSRFDFAKLEHLNGLYLRAANDRDLLESCAALLEQRLGRSLTTTERHRIETLMPTVKIRAKTVAELADMTQFLVEPRPLAPDASAEKLLDAEASPLLVAVAERLGTLAAFDTTETEAAVRSYAEANGLKLGKVAQPLRAALTGRSVSPPVFDVLGALGRAESLARLRDAIDFISRRP